MWKCGTETGVGTDDEGVDSEMNGVGIHEVTFKTSNNTLLFAVGARPPFGTLADEAELGAGLDGARAAELARPDAARIVIVA